MSAFSRLQLAAALIEYDNDDEHPHAPRRSAQDSAIFSHARQARPRPASRKSADYLSVALPSDGQDSTSRRSANDNRRSRASTVNVLRNPFGPDEHDGEDYSEEHYEEDMEVDLASWGLDAFKDTNEGKAAKASKKVRGRTKSETLDRSAFEGAHLEVSSPRTRAMSMGNFDGFGLGGAFLDASSSVRPPGARPHSVSSPLDLADLPAPSRPTHLRRASDHALIDSIATAPPLHAVAFPRSATPSGDLSSGPRPASRASRAELQATHTRTLSGASDSMLAYDQLEQPMSRASIGSQLLGAQESDNLFSVPAPSSDRASRFDPKAQRARALSNASRELLADENANAGNDPERSQPPRARTTSHLSMGSQMPMGREDDVPERRRRQRPYSKWDLMRPKVLIMPSPLQDPNGGVEQSVHTRDGFHMSSGEPPLPPSARPTRRSAVLSAIQPSSSLAPPNAFPGSRSNLTLSQMTFRNTLAVDGQNTVAPPRATEDGQQVDFPELEEPPKPSPVESVPEDQDEMPKPKRPAGKLYGRSLIDNLEDRKIQMRSKQRVYRGDDRPAMMERPGMPRSSTLIDPASLQQRPNPERLDSFNTTASAPLLGARQSVGGKSLLNIADEHGNLVRPRPVQSQSVFGVDSLWEREMAKLREIEEQERRQKEGAEAETAIETGKLKNDNKTPLAFPRSPADDHPSGGMPSRSLSQPIAAPPVLPEIQRATVRRPPPPTGDDSGDEDEDESDGEPREMDASAEAAGWESPDEAVPSGRPRAASSFQGPRVAPMGQGDDDSDEDVPLAATISRVAARTIINDDSDEEKPLSSLMDRAKLGIPNINFDAQAAHNAGHEDEDDKPLAFRASTVFNQGSLHAGSLHAGSGLDDDAPLAMHPEHQRRSQYALAQQQQQQQMMMMQAQMQMQAQMHQSMFFGAPMGTPMGTPFMGPGGMPPMMMAPPQIPSPPPLHDAAKFGRVDRWRRDVAVEDPAEK